MVHQLRAKFYARCAGAPSTKPECQIIFERGDEYSDCWNAWFEYGLAWNSSWSGPSDCWRADLDNLNNTDSTPDGEAPPLRLHAAF